MTAPYSPTVFATPQINPNVGGFGAPIPYISISQYNFAPTAMDTSALVPGGTSQDQEQALYDTILRASRWADRYVYGMDAAAKGASLAASLSVQAGFIPLLKGELRLICDYKPILEVVGVDVGSFPGTAVSIGSAAAAQIRFGRRTIYVPLGQNFIFGKNVTSSSLPLSMSQSGKFYTVWSYVNGYPHTSLGASVLAGADTVTLTATNGNGGLYGVYPGTQLTIVDGVNTETFQVQSLNGNVATTVQPIANSHTLPTAPDFLPVTALGSDIELAVIFLTTALIKTRGDFSIELQGMEQPNAIKSEVGDVQTDVAYAMELLDPYRIHLKSA